MKKDYLLKSYLMPHPPIMIPDVGAGEEKKIQQTIDACNRVGNEISELEPETIILITPHGPVFSDAIAISLEEGISGNLSQFNAPNINLELDIDLKLTNKIMELADAVNIQTVGINKNMLSQYKRKFELDHGSIVPLYFVNQSYKKYKIVHITYGMLSLSELYHLGRIIKKAIQSQSRKTVIIASGDLSHRLSDEGPYSYSPKGKLFDEAIISSLEEGKVLEIFNMNQKEIEEAGECGYRSILILLGAIGQFNAQVLSYEGPFGVGYGVIAFETTGDLNVLDHLRNNALKSLEVKKKHSDAYVTLARESIEYFFEHNKLMEIPTYLPDEILHTRSGVFVSLHKHGNLRGCIGTFLPTTQSLAQEIIQNALEAALHDPRFSPVEVKEMIDINISVDVLSEPHKTDVDGLDPMKYGVIVTQGYKRGLLLPRLDGVDTVSEQLTIACEKAGIDPESHYDLEKFEVIRHVEGEKS